jgi:hypothetical protein
MGATLTVSADGGVGGEEMKKPPLKLRDGMGANRERKIQ